jgi:hypothetical protein
VVFAARKKIKMKKVFLAIAFLCASGTLFSMELPEGLKVERVISVPSGSKGMVLKGGGYVVVEEDAKPTIMIGNKIYNVPAEYFGLIAERIKQAQKAQ